MLIFTYNIIYIAHLKTSGVDQSALQKPRKKKKKNIKGELQCKIGTDVLLHQRFSQPFSEICLYDNNVKSFIYKNY